MNKLEAKNIVKYFDDTPHTLQVLDGINIATGDDGSFAVLDTQIHSLLLVEMQLVWEKIKNTILFVACNAAESVVRGIEIAVFSHYLSSIRKEFGDNFQRHIATRDESLLKSQSNILDEFGAEVSKTRE